jgi:hypothetical protein
MPNVTLDKNCVIDLEEGRSASVDVRRLIELNDSSRICVCLPAIMASERLRDGTYRSNFIGFEEWLQSLGLAHLKLLYPPAYLDITFFDRSIFADEYDDLEKQIHAILFPDLEFTFADFCAARGVEPNSGPSPKWRNAKFDVLSMWCHIHYAGDIFVTSDENFHKAAKKPQLIALGAKAIMRPSEASSYLT